MVEISSQDLFLALKVIGSSLVSAIAFLVYWVKSSLEKIEANALKEINELRDALELCEKSKEAQNTIISDLKMRCAKLEAKLEFYGGKPDVSL